MKRFSKGLFSFAGACLIIGLVMCVIGFALGGRAQNMSLWRNGPEFFHFNYDSIAFWGHGSHGGATGAGRTEALSSAQAADVSALDIDVDACSVQLQEGDAFTVAASADGACDGAWGRVACCADDVSTIQATCGMLRGRRVVRVARARCTGGGVLRAARKGQTRRVVCCWEVA